MQNYFQVLHRIDFVEKVALNGGANIASLIIFIILIISPILFILTILIILIVLIVDRSLTYNLKSKTLAHLKNKTWGSRCI